MVKERLSENVLRTRLLAAMKTLDGGKPLIEGSLSAVKVTCGNPNCRCAQGEKHVSHLLTSKVKGKSKSVYVPTDMVEEVSAWVAEHRRIKKALKEISALSEQIIRQHVAVRRAVAKNRPVKKESSPT